MQRGGRATHERGSLGARVGGCLWLLGLVWVPSLALGQAGITYLYDAHGRLAAVVDPSADPASNVALYRYDAVGNITAIERTGGATVTVLGFAPRCASAGTSVRVTGTGYSPTPSQNAVTLGGIPATVTAAAATELTVTVPGGAASGSIAVTAPGGGATSTESFTVGCAAPTITGFG